MKKTQKITVKGIEVVTFEHNERDYISLTDIAKYKGIAETDRIMKEIDQINFLETPKQVKTLNLTST